MQGYKTDQTAYRAAQKRGLVGLNGGGQACYPQILPDGSWGYQTSTDYFHMNWHEKSIMVRGGKLMSLVDAGFEEGIPLNFQEDSI